MFISSFFHITWARNRGDERTQLEAEMGLQHQPQQQTSVQISVFIWCLGILILKLKRFHGSILHNMKMKNKFLCVSFDQGHRSSRAWSTRGGGWVASSVQDPGDSQSRRWWRCDHCTVVPVMSMSCHQWYILWDALIHDICCKEQALENVDKSFKSRKVKL